MSPVNPIPVIIALFVAISVAAVLPRSGSQDGKGRFASVDGLRGYLAFFVFMHHACSWYFLIQHGSWGMDSQFYAQLGDVSVVLFFMITGLLFCHKLGEARTRPIDWGRLFVSRFLRLVPLYLLAVTLLLLIVAFSTFGHLNQPIDEMAVGVAKWYAMTLFGEPDINGRADTKLILCGVTWTIVYEIAFYVCLPLISLVFLSVPPLKWISFSVTCIGLMYWFSEWRPAVILLAPFASGGVASVLARFEVCRRFSATSVGAVAALSLGAIAVVAYSSPYELVPLFLLTIAFALVACGSDLFGVLTAPAVRSLGDISYGMYLLHGIVLCTTFEGILGLEYTRSLSPVWYWAVVVGVTPSLVVIAFITSRTIEKPCMRRTDATTAWLRGLKNRLFLPKERPAIVGTNPS